MQSFLKILFYDWSSNPARDKHSFLSVLVLFWTFYEQQQITRSELVENAKIQMRHLGWFSNTVHNENLLEIYIF